MAASCVTEAAGTAVFLITLGSCCFLLLLWLPAAFPSAIDEGATFLVR